MRRPLLLAALLLAAACSKPAQPPANQAAGPAPAPVPEGPPPPAETALAGITNVERQYYDVSGTNLFAVRRALNQARPRDPNDGLGVDALSSWYIEWRWPAATGSGCNLANAEIRFRARIRMPRFVETPDTPEGVRSRWQSYVTALERHEANHIRHAWDNRNLVLAAIRASSCANADRDARAVIAQLVQGDVAYDQRTRHGMLEGAHFP